MKAFAIKDPSNRITVISLINRNHVENLFEERFGYRFCVAQSLGKNSNWSFEEVQINPKDSVLIDREKLAKALQAAWDDYVVDTGCYPDFLEVDNNIASADFIDHGRAFVETTMALLQAGIEGDKNE